MKGSANICVARFGLFFRLFKGTRNSVMKIEYKSSYMLYKLSLCFLPNHINFSEFFV